MVPDRSITFDGLERPMGPIFRTNPPYIRLYRFANWKEFGMLIHMGGA